VKIFQLILLRIIEIVATRYQILRLNVLNSISAGALSQIPLWELTGLPQTIYLHSTGLLLAEGRGKEGKERTGEGRKEAGKGGEEKGWEVPPAFLISSPGCRCARIVSDQYVFHCDR